MKLLSIIIPARNEEWLQNTIDDIFLHSELGDDMEVLVGLDECKVDCSYLTYPKINLGITRSKEAIGQRAMQNRLAKIAEGKYIMKLDAHVSMSQGFEKLCLKS